MAQKAPPSPTTYLATVDPPATEEEQIVARGKPLAQLVVRPERAVILAGTLAPEIARRTAVTEGFAFTPGRVLYGTHDREGLFFDLMRNRGLGSSVACLRDSDGDGAFDAAVRYDFNSGGADMVFITDKGKVRGGRLKLTLPLDRPLPYIDAPDEAFPTGRLALLWNSKRKRTDLSDQPTIIEFVASDGQIFPGRRFLLIVSLF